MNTEQINRLMEAKKYQEKAIKALFPENMQSHVEVIQKEVSSMVKEGLLQLLQSPEGMELLKKMMGSANKSDCDSESKSQSKAKKVNIM